MVKYRYMTKQITKNTKTRVKGANVSLCAPVHISPYLLIPRPNISEQRQHTNFSTHKF